MPFDPRDPKQTEDLKRLLEIGSMEDGDTWLPFIAVIERVRDLIDGQDRGDLTRDRAWDLVRDAVGMKRTRP